jgi:ankyrin repeat protein
MIKRLRSFWLALVFATAHGLLVTTPALASVPNLAPPEWEDISKILKDQTLPLTWHDASGNSIVYYHIHFGTEADAVRLLQRARVQRVSIRDGKSLAYFSAVNGKEFALRELLAGGVSPNAVPGEESLLMAAARQEQLGIMRLLIASGADVNYKFQVAISPDELLDAATSALKAGKYNAARLLFSSGYNLEKGGQAQTRELFFAAIAGGASTAVMYMLDHFNVKDASSSDGETPLTFAIKAGTTDAVISELLMRGADPCKRNKANESAEDVLNRLNKDKKPYDARYVFVHDRLICRHKKP